MYRVELYGRIRRACHVEGMSIREAARPSWVVEPQTWLVPPPPSVKELPSPRFPNRRCSIWSSLCVPFGCEDD